MSINLLAILVAALVNFGLGVLWYSPLGFGRGWLQALGKTRADLGSVRAPLVMTLITSFIMAFALGVVLSAGGIVTWAEGFLLGIVIGCGIVAMGLVPMMVLERRPRGLFLINSGYAALGITLMSAIIAGWR